MKIKYRKGYKYQLAEGVSYQTNIVIPADIETDYILMTDLGQRVTAGAMSEIHIRTGYAYDGPSGPAMDTKTFMRASLFHDAMYQLMRLKLLSTDHRGQADKIMKEICLEDGMSRIRAAYTFHAVRLFGKRSAEPENVRKIITAP